MDETPQGVLTNFHLLNYNNMEAVLQRTTFTVSSILHRVSSVPLSSYSINRACAYLRARHCCAYDPIAGEQCMTLEQMESNKSIILAALDMLTDGSIRVNGYKIRYNPLWTMWQCLYEGAIYGEFRLLPDAIEYCEKG